MPNLPRYCVTNTAHVSLPDPIAAVDRTMPVTAKSIKPPVRAATGVEVES